MMTKAGANDVNWALGGRERERVRVCSFCNKEGNKQENLHPSRTPPADRTHRQACSWTSKTKRACVGSNASQRALGRVRIATNLGPIALILQAAWACAWACMGAPGLPGCLPRLPRALPGAAWASACACAWACAWGRLALPGRAWLCLGMPRRVPGRCHMIRHVCRERPF